MPGLKLERLMIVAGESSGELYGALLATRVRALLPELKITGIGGDRMEAAGVELITRITSTFGLLEAARTYRNLRQTFRKAVDTLSSFNPQVIVLIDYPDFNIKLAAEAKKKGIKVFYYVSPQVWAWRKGRIYTISKLVDKMAVILPFEEDLYRETGLSCEFVGHPVMDEIRHMIGGEGYALEEIGSENLKSRMKKKLGLDETRPLLTLMPGSRRHEISRLLPMLSVVVSKMQKKHPEYQYVIPVAPNIDKALFDSAALPESCRLVQQNSIEALAACDAAVIASGTSTLQAALLGAPMVVVYKLSGLTYFVGKLLVKVKYIGLVNLLLEKSVNGETGLRITELLQDDASAENVLAELSKIIDKRVYRDEMLSQLDGVRKLYVGRRASERVAEMVAGMVK